jgi:dolichol-phosphate mannosyltransferase
MELPHLVAPRRQTKLVPMAEYPVHASVIVPTYREAPNLRALADRVFAATEAARIDAELLFVDDNSRDGSKEIVADLARERPVRMVVRTEERGLSSAVLRGFADARFDLLVVMDADLSHPPEAIPDLVTLIAEERADFAIGSRYVRGGDIAEEWSFLRYINSRAATLLARPLTPVRDPMSGFFALHRRTLDQAAALNPIGYKIALELMVKARCRRVVEVPIHFAQRHAGESKLSLSEQLKYVRHVLRLYWFRLTAR